jgi:hypothetical protein
MRHIENCLILEHYLFDIVQVCGICFFNKAKHKMRLRGQGG